MKILQLTYSLGSGGAERFVVDLSNELSKDRFNKVVLVTMVDDTILQNRHYLSELAENVEYICLGTKSGFSWKSFIATVRIIRQLRPDIVHAHCNLLLLYFPALFLRRSKYLHTLHNLAETCLRFKFLKPINKFFYRNHIQPITISNVCQRSYEKLYKLKNAVCIPNGRTPISTTAELSFTQREISSFKITDQDKVFIHIARFHKQKNQQLLFDTFCRLYKENEKVQLLVIGAGYHNMNNLFEKGACPSIHILGEKKNIGDYLSCSDFFILSSSWEGLPISLLEAMSKGVVPVCTPAGGIPDVIVDGVTGYLSTSFNSEDFYLTVKRALADADILDRNKIVQEYRNKYSMTGCMEDYLNIYVQ